MEVEKRETGDFVIVTETEERKTSVTPVEKYTV